MFLLLLTGRAGTQKQSYNNQIQAMDGVYANQSHSPSLPTFGWITSTPWIAQASGSATEGSGAVNILEGEVNLKAVIRISRI